MDTIDLKIFITNSVSEIHLFFSLSTEANIGDKLELAGYAIWFYTYSTWLGRDVYLGNYECILLDHCCESNQCTNLLKLL